MTQTLETVSVDAEQVLTGLQVGSLNHASRCTACGRSLHKADRVRVYAYQLAGEATITVSRLYCRGCKDEILPTLGATEVLADAVLGLQATPEGTHDLTLTDVQVAAASPASEGCD